MSAPETVSDPDLQEVAWDLSDLLNGAGAGDPQAGVDALLADAQTRADAFAASLRRQARRDRRRRPRRRHAASSPRSRRSPAAPAPTRTSSSASTPQTPANGALLQRVEEKGTAIETKLLFFHLEWAALDDAKAEELLATDGLDFARHHLATARRYRPHLLSEPEERILAEKQLPGPLGVGAAVRGADGGDHRRPPTAPSPCALDVALVAPVRRRTARCARTTAERVTAALQPGLRTRAYAFNTLLADKMVDDRLRAYPHWLASRNLSNEASDESVQALIEAVRARYELPRRWYRLKAQLLGIDKLADYDRMAAVTQDNEKVAWPEAKEIVLDAYSTSPASSAGSSTASSTNAGSTARCARASAAARSAPTACRRAPVRAAQLHATCAATC